MNSNPLGYLRLLYGIALVVAVPLVLVAWAVGAQPQIFLPVPGSPALGLGLAAAGGALLVAGIASILRYGEGLPVNAYSPARFVTQGAYRIVRHPIYAGFALLAFGVSMCAKSSSGFWLVAPMTALGCAALVLGYESLDLRRRFGRVAHRPCLSLPAASDAARTQCDRLSVDVLVLLPWLAVYAALAALGPAPDAVEAYFSFERRWPVFEWAEALYASTYLFVLLVPLVARRARDLRAFALGGLLATAVAALLWTAIPLVSTPRPFEPSGPLGRLLLFQRAYNVSSNAFPSFHVVWAFLAAAAFSSRWPKARRLWLGLAWGIAVSCVVTGMHAFADVLAGALLYVAVSRRDAVWEHLRRSAEAIANSWREWRVGPLRIVNHSLYAGAGGVVAIGLVGTLLGKEALLPAILVAMLGVVCAALSAHLIEGSPKLLRPYGYFAAVAGAVGASIGVSFFFGIEAWHLLAAFCVAGPWIVAVGRLRCLVRGCCHGAAAPAWLGIRYVHASSRVVRLTGAKGVPLHPTQLYSILWNVAIGILLLRFWLLKAPLSLVVGVYLLLAGLGRFAEEAYRGDQTPVRWRLRLYQWLAAASVAAGALATVARTQPASGVFEPTLTVAGAALAFGLLTAAAYGIDFPESKARSRA